MVATGFREVEGEAGFVVKLVEGTENLAGERTKELSVRGEGERGEFKDVEEDNVERLG